MALTIVALSDSHTSTLGQLPSTLRGALQNADVIVHAGDFTEASLLDELRTLGDVVAVSGNMDSTAIKMQLTRRQLVPLDGKVVGVVHGSGAPAGIERRVRELFPENPDLIIFGHSHVPFCGVVDGVLMVNPGPAREGYATITVGDKPAARLVSIT